MTGRVVGKRSTKFIISLALADSRSFGVCVVETPKLGASAQKSPETGGKSPETGGKSPETGGKSPETGGIHAQNGPQ